MADREVSDGRGKVFERGTHGYFVGALGRSVRDRGRRNLVVKTRGIKEGMTKKDLFGKKSRKKKNEKSHQHGRHGNRPSFPLKTDLRVSL